MEEEIKIGEKDIRTCYKAKRVEELKKLLISRDITEAMRLKKIGCYECDGKKPTCEHYK